MARSEREIEEQQERIRRRMLEAEAALLFLLRGSAVTSAAQLADAAAELERRLALVYVAGRERTRQVMAVETAAELDTLLPAADPGSGVYRTAARPPDDYEAWRGRRAARGYSRHWLDDAERAAALGLDDAAEAARLAQEWRLEMGAATESAEAASLERERILREWAEQRPFAASEVWKVWDATLDKRTCRTCASAHGVVVRLHEPFPAGRPGGVHPNCRCTFQILTTDEVDFDYLAAA
jgi:hypothetical protein